MRRLSKGEATSVYLRTAPREALIQAEAQEGSEEDTEARGVYDKGRGAVTSRKEGVAIGADNVTQRC